LCDAHPGALEAPRGVGLIDDPIDQRGGHAPRLVEVVDREEDAACDEVPPTEDGSYARQQESSEDQLLGQWGQEDDRRQQCEPAPVAVEVLRDSIGLDGLGEIPGQRSDAPGAPCCPCLSLLKSRVAVESLASRPTASARRRPEPYSTAKMVVSRAAIAGLLSGPRTRRTARRPAGLALAVIFPRHERHGHRRSLSALTLRAVLDVARARISAERRIRRVARNRTDKRHSTRRASQMWRINPPFARLRTSSSTTLIGSRGNRW
jgi:hypothetical protein